MDEKIKKIKALVMDVDGVLTDGRIIYDSDGREIKLFDVQDGFGIMVLQRLGYRTAIISARSAKPVDIRAQDLKIHKVYQDASPKSKAFDQMLRDFQMAEEQICFVGDDLPDLEVLARAGFAVAVKNATREAKDLADYVTTKRGGRGAVREVIELILKTQGRWEEALAQFKRP
jgi:3-deoxy-D-manno-octulosonate 8-phosphate phosphatase (KDO 8-P phosphatase)